MVPNSMTKFSEDIFPSIDLCQHNIMGPFVMNEINFCGCVKGE